MESAATAEPFCATIIYACLKFYQHASCASASRKHIERDSRPCSVCLYSLPLCHFCLITMCYLVEFVTDFTSVCSCLTCLASDEDMNFCIMGLSLFFVYFMRRAKSWSPQYNARQCYFSSDICLIIDDEISLVSCQSHRISVSRRQYSGITISRRHAFQALQRVY